MNEWNCLLSWNDRGLMFCASDPEKSESYCIAASIEAWNKCSGGDQDGAEVGIGVGI